MALQENVPGIGYSIDEGRVKSGEYSEIAIKDSGARAVFASGMQRDITAGKIDYTLIFDGPMFERWAAHLTKGALKYEPRNWMKANSDEELQRAREAVFRHFVQWFRGDMDEDHAAAVFFNINEIEFIKAGL